MKKIILLLIFVISLSSCIVNLPGLKNETDKLYNIILSPSIENGNVSVNKTIAKEGDIIYLNVTPNQGYQFDYFIVLEEIYKTTSFVMPASDVEIYVSFIKNEEKEEQENCDHYYDGRICSSCGNVVEYSYLKELFDYNIDIYTNDEENPYNIDLNAYGSDVVAYFYNPKLSGTTDPYTNVNKTTFYANYKEATTYEDAYYRTEHNLMSGDITDQYYLPTEEKKVENNIALRATTATYVLDTYGNYIAYITNAPKGKEDVVFYGAAYTSLNEVAAYLLAFGEVPANQMTDKGDTAISKAISLWGKYGRVNDGSFSGNPTKYPFQPILPRISGNDSILYREMDFGTTGGYINSNSVGTYYNQTVYNTGSSISRGAARFCYVNDSKIKNINERYVFYTYNHYNDFQEYLNYYNGWGYRFGNVSAGNEYCGDRYDFADLNCVSPTQYPEILLRKYSEII